MDAEKTFRVYAEPEEAARLCNYITLDPLCASKEAYKLGYELFGGDRSMDVFYRQMRGLTCVYLLGFLSGSRAIRTRNKQKKHHNISANLDKP